LVAEINLKYNTNSVEAEKCSPQPKKDNKLGFQVGSKHWQSIRGEIALKTEESENFKISDLTRFDVEQPNTFRKEEDH